MAIAEVKRLRAATKTLYKLYSLHRDASQAVLLTIHVLESHQQPSGFAYLLNRQMRILRIEFLPEGALQAPFDISDSTFPKRTRHVYLDSSRVVTK